MEPRLVPSSALAPGGADKFSGTVSIAAVAPPEAAIHLYEVHFGARSRTFWHRHTGEQILVCMQGRVVVQTRQEAPRTLGLGESVRIPAGAIHWHGALESAASHLAINIAAETEWLEAVSESDYAAALAACAAAKG